MRLWFVGEHRRRGAAAPLPVGDQFLVQQVRIARLSVQPVTDDEWEMIEAMSTFA